MTLFDVLVEYQRWLKEFGEIEAEMFLADSISPELHKHIRGSFDSDGSPLSYSNMLGEDCLHPQRFEFGV